MLDNGIYFRPWAASKGDFFHAIAIFPPSIVPIDRRSYTHPDGQLRLLHGEVVVLAPHLFCALDAGHGRYPDQAVRRQLVHVLGRLHVRVYVLR